MLDFFRLTLQRRSCRKFIPKTVEKEKLLNCVRAARIAPSACNGQPWSFVVVNRRSLSRQAAECIRYMGLNRHVTGDSAFIAVVEEKTLLATRIGGVVRMQRYPLIDIGIATGHILLAAQAQGLSTCVLGWFNEAKLKSLLHIPRRSRIRLVVAVGYADAGPAPRTGRKALSELLTYLD